MRFNINGKRVAMALWTQATHPYSTGVYSVAKGDVIVLEGDMPNPPGTYDGVVCWFIPPRFVEV
jgi:hypothetical protein